jgi:cytochrome P450
MLCTCSAMDPAFKHKNIRTLVPMFAHCTRKLINKWEQQLDQPIRVEDGLTEVTLDAIGWSLLATCQLVTERCCKKLKNQLSGMGAFGYDFGAVDGVKEIGKNLEHYKRIMAAVFRPTDDDNNKLEQSIQEFQTFLQHVINTRR